MPSLFSANDFSVKAKTLVDNFNSPNRNESSMNPIEVIFGIGLFLLPLFFLPFTADAINVNKAYLLMALAAISLSMLFFQAWKKGSLYVKDFRTYLPVILLLVAGLVSVYFSQNRRVSIFGQYGTYGTSFIVLLSLGIIAFVASNVRLRVPKLYRAFVWGVTAASLLSWMGLYHAYIPGVGTLFPGFSLAESFSAMLGLQVLAALLTLYMLLRVDIGKTTSRGLVYGFTIIINLAFPLVVVNLYAIVLLVLGLIYLAVFMNENNFSRNKYLLGAISLVILLLVAFHHLPNIKNVLGFEADPQVARLDIAPSWYVSASSLIQNPVWGSGLGTFINDFTRFKPASLNQTPFWNLRFFTPFNDVFLWVATAGLVGAAAYLIFLYMVTSSAWKMRNEASNSYPAFGIIAGVLALLLLGSSAALYFLLFVMVGILFQGKGSSMASLKSKGLIMMLFVLSLGLIGALAFQAYHVYAAQYFFRQSLTKNSLVDRHQLQRKALSFDKYEPFYYREALATNMVMASRISNAKI